MTEAEKTIVRKVIGDIEDSRHRVDAASREFETEDLPESANLGIAYDRLGESARELRELLRA